LNISFLQLPDDPRLSLATGGAGLERARRLGFRDWTIGLAGNVANAELALGHWDSLLAKARDLLGDLSGLTSDASDLLGMELTTRALRGDEADLGPRIARFDEVMAPTQATQEQTMLMQVHAWIDLAAGRLEAVKRVDLTDAEPSIGLVTHTIVGHAAAWTRDLARLQASLDGLIGTNLHGRWASAQRRAMEAGIDALEGRQSASEAAYKEALGALRELETLRDVALVAMDQASLSEDPSVVAAAADEARRIWTSLGASAALARLDELLAKRPDIALDPASSTRTEGAPVEVV
jgi:hypothetical protein